jgi:hypothetical protein
MVVLWVALMMEAADVSDAGTLPPDFSALEPRRQPAVVRIVAMRTLNANVASLIDWLAIIHCTGILGRNGVVFMNVCVVITVVLAVLLSDFGPYRIMFITV